MDIIRLPKSVSWKRRKVSKKRDALRKELALFKKEMCGEGKRL